MQDDRSPHRHRLQTLLAERGAPKSLQRAGDTVSLSPSARLHILHPPAQSSRGLADDKVVVTRLDVAHVRILFLSDASFATEQWLLANAPDALQCDILVKGRPRSGPSGDSAFLNAARPTVVIATAADFPASEKLEPEFAAELATRGITLFRQDQTGAVTIRVFPTGWQASAFLGNQRYPLPSH